MVDDLTCMVSTLNQQAIIRETDHMEVSGINYILEKNIKKRNEK